MVLSGDVIPLNLCIRWCNDCVRHIMCIGVKGYKFHILNFLSLTNRRCCSVARLLQQNVDRMPFYIYREKLGVFMLGMRRERSEKGKVFLHCIYSCG
jgi:hypothetical protein